ncbi:MAG TPA: hypothetical protein VGO43_00205 [Pyrinomonadaceae bacterium]|jgi:hypothetical protein|nr:hypothetical protein [Pyrinomonadaceae bacterium]
MADTIFSLVLLSIVVASIAWTVTQEEIFSEPRDYCERKCKTARSALERKFFYVFTCEYCFSHWVTLVLLAITNFRLVFEDWRGLIVSFFVLPWLANQWMSIYRRLRVSIKHENALAEIAEEIPETKKKTASR